MSEVVTIDRPANSGTAAWNAPAPVDAAARRIDLEYVIQTPENVTLSYQLAGPAVRLSAWLIDLLLRIGMILFAWMYILAPLSLAGAGMSMAAFFILFFVVDWFYFGISEGLFRGKTIGKHLFGLRVIHEEGYPLTIWGAILRNFVRAGDAVPVYAIIPLHGLGLVSMVAAGRFRRLGDLAARTLVIEERRVSAPKEPVILEKIEPLPRGDVSGYVPAARTLSLIEQFLSRRSALTYRRGHDMAAVLARALAAKLNYSADRDLVEKYPMAFLARVYATFYRVRDESDDVAREGRR